MEELDDGNRRRALIEGAARLFRTQGFDATSTRDIAAAAADIGHGTNEDDASSRQSDEASTTSESEEESEEESSEGDDEGENDAEEHGGRAMRALNRYLAAEESARSPTTHHPRETP